jgi:hypothetical protein
MEIKMNTLEQIRTKYDNTIQLTLSDMSVMKQEIETYQTKAKANIVFLDRLNKRIEKDSSGGRYPTLISQADLDKFAEIFLGNN